MKQEGRLLTTRRGLSSGPGLECAVGEAALELARNCYIPGVNEAAMAVSILVNLLIDNENNTRSTEGNMRQCRSIIKILERASTVLGKVGGIWRLLRLSASILHLYGGMWSSAFVYCSVAVLVLCVMVHPAFGKSIRLHEGRSPY